MEEKKSETKESAYLFWLDYSSGNKQKEQAISFFLSAKSLVSGAAEPAGTPSSLSRHTCRPGLRMEKEADESSISF